MLKFYVSHQEDDFGWKTLIRTHAKDIVTEYDCRCTTYVEKENINNIAEYRWKAYDEMLGDEKAENYLFLNIEDIPEKIKKFIQEERESINDYNNSWLVEEYGILTEEELKEFYMQMKEESISGDLLPEERVIYFWNGSNHRRIVLESDLLDTDYVDYTDELEGWEEIDSKEYNTGKNYLYRTPSGDTYLVNVSWYQGVMDSIMKVPDSVENIEEAEKRQ